MANDINKLHPWLQYKIDLFVKKAEKKGYKVGIGECFRTVAKQDALYAQGRTKPGNIVTNVKGSTYSSQHQWGIAFDIFRNDGKGAYTDSDGWFTKVSKVAKSVGLGWGGDWKSIVDKPHYYLKKWGDTPSKLKIQYGTFANFKKTWKTTATYKAGTRIRKTRIFTSKVLMIIPEGGKCDVLWKSKFGYSKVKYKGIVGFAKNKYLS